jgi:carnitine 3-dehydrogenase
VGGRQTAPEAVAWAAEFYRTSGKHVLELEREAPGFVANRLQEALWREALHMVATGEASVAEIDAAITEGPGLRWAAMGPCLTFHLAGGNGGMAHMLDHFGPALEQPWTRLTAPELTDDLRRRLIEGCLYEANGRSIADLLRQRDEALISILAARNPTT